jgi:hypothetical protein
MSYEDELGDLENSSTGEMEGLEEEKLRAEREELPEIGSGNLGDWSAKTMQDLDAGHYEEHVKD